MNLTINPKYAELVPPLTPEEFESLKESIKERGLDMSVLVNSELIVLDGHHRFRACQELGVPIKYAIREFDNKLDEIIFVGECNLKRRQLSTLQKIALVEKLKPYYAEKAKQNSLNNLKQNTEVVILPPQGKTRDILAEQAGTSGRTFEKGVEVLKKASDEDINKINTGEKSISKVYREITKDEKKEQRQQEIQQTQVNLPKNVMLYNQEFQSAPVPENSVSLIMTDPDYTNYNIQVYSDLAKQAMKILKDGGSILCYTGHYIIPEVLNAMIKEGLTYHWIIPVLHSGPSSLMYAKKIMVGYKPLLWFTKGKYDGDHVKDVIQSKFQGKELHEWAQSTVESDYYIKHMTEKNEIVYDPCMGQGTFGISAVTQNRQFIGCEIQKDHYETAQRLLSVKQTPN